MTQNKLIEALGVISILAAPKGNPAVALIVLKAIRETAEKALSTAQAQEPVAWLYEKNGKRLQPTNHRHPELVQEGFTETALFASPPAPSTPDARVIVEACAAEAAKYFDGALKPAVGWTDTQARWWEFGVDDAASAIAAAIRALPLPTPSAPDAALREAWQPIDTAPKDGTRFLALCKGIIGIWHWQGPDGGRPVGWREAIYVYKCDNPNGPDRWTPLPAAPTLSTAQGEGA